MACRRARVFDEVAVIYSKSTTHPTAPKKAKNFRVEDYWSVMTVRPTQGWNEPGLEFSLTAFENPGLRLPRDLIQSKTYLLWLWLSVYKVSLESSLSCPHKLR